MRLEHLDLSAEHREVISRLETLAGERFAPRAARYDRETVFPEEDFDDLFREGFLTAAISEDEGGLGLGPLQGNTLALWMLTRTLARADLSLARCFEGHANSMVLLDGLAEGERRREWIAGIVERGERWTAWSGEPSARKKGEPPAKFGTTLEAVDGGWILDGSKIFATSAVGADWAFLLVNPAGSGGARNAPAEIADQLLLLACRLDDETITTDPSWWDPVGMRATVSHVVRFDRTFIPADHQVGPPGEYLRGGWQTRFIPHYAASFLGAALGAWDVAREHVGKKGADAYAEHRVARMSNALDTAYLWLQHVGSLWDRGATEAAQAAGNQARYLVEHLALETLDHAIRLCGARSLIRPSAVERILRDLTFYVRHDSADHVLATIGKAVLGAEHDVAFYKP